MCKPARLARGSRWLLPARFTHGRHRTVRNDKPNLNGLNGKIACIKITLKPLVEDFGVEVLGKPNLCCSGKSRSAVQMRQVEMALVFTICSVQMILSTVHLTE